MTNVEFQNVWSGFNDRKITLNGEL
jgi:hypothetical protein